MIEKVVYEMDDLANFAVEHFEKIRPENKLDTCWRIVREHNDIDGQIVGIEVWKDKEVES